MSRRCHRVSGLRHYIHCGLKSALPGAAAAWLGLTFAAPAQAPDKNGVSPNTVSLPSGPGSIEGLGEAFQPTLNTGTAKYGIAIRVPPGTRGAAPEVTLRYEGGSGNGPLGCGWSLPIPFVQRQTDKGVPRYIDGPNGIDDDFDGQTDETDELDRFIDTASEELVPVANPGAGTIDFFSENEESFTRYRRVGDYWEARLPDGTRQVFGRSATARIADASDTTRIFRWLLEEQADPNGNTIRYRYQSFAGAQNLNQLYCAAIEYGPGAPGWGGNFQFVAFDYEDRADWFEDCGAGFPVRTGKRMLRIVTGTQGPALPGHLEGDFNADTTPDHLNRRYDLAYHPAIPASLLAGITVVGCDGSSTLPPSHYQYTLAQEPEAISAAAETLYSLGEPATVFDLGTVDFIDLNGDSLPDLLDAGGGGVSHRVNFNMGQGTDSLGDPVIRWSTQSEVAKSTTGANPWVLGLSDGAVVLADTDGDGRADLVQMTPFDTYFYQNRPQPGGQALWGPQTALEATDHIPPSPFGSSPGVKTADINFDKRIDIIQSIPSGGNHFYHIWFRLADNTFSARVTVSPPNGYDLSATGVFLAELNGDRLTDVARIQVDEILVTSGLGHGAFLAEESIPIPDFTLTGPQLAKASLHDVNGDGLDDLVVDRPVSGELWFWPNRGNRTLGDRIRITNLPAISSAAAVRWVDINGNGTTDLVFGNSSAAAGERIVAIDIGRLIGCVPAPYLLKHIENGIGRSEEIDYATSVDFALADGTAAGGDYVYPWADPLPLPVTVISEIRTSDSLGATYITRFRYHDGYYDPEDKQFRGFGRVEQVEPGDATAPTLVSRSRFDVGQADEAMKGRVLEFTREEESGAVFDKAVTDWDTRTLHTGTDGRSVRFAHPVSVTTDILEKDVGTPRRTYVEQDYDNYGNQTAERNYGIIEGTNLAAFNDERITATTFAYNLADWLLRYPFEVEMRDASGTVVNRSRTYYDDPDFSGNNGGVVTIGNATLIRRWIDPAVPAAFIAAQRTRFDGFGNPVDLFDPLHGQKPGHWRRITYDPAFHAYPETETIHVDGAVATLEFEARYDHGFGTIIRAEDFNDNVTSFGYDPFARLATIVKPYDSEESPTVEYDYLLAQPFGTGGIVNWIETRERETAGGGQFITREFSDGLGRKRLVKHEEEAAGRYVTKQAATFNARRAVWQTSNPYLSTSFTFELPDSGVSVVATRYDATLRPLAMVNQDHSETRSEYEPLLVRKFDENDITPGSKHFGTPMVEHSDGLGRLLRVDEVVKLTDQGEETGTPTTWSTVYRYRADDALLSFTDSQDNTKVMHYDGLGRMTFMDDPDRGGMSTIYDAASNMTQTTDNKGQVIKYTHDGANRILTEDFLDEGLPFSANHAFDPGQPITPANRPDVAYFYDVPVAGLDLGDGTTGTATKVLGKLAYVWDITGEAHFSYDARTRLMWDVKRIPDAVVTSQLVAYRTGYAYDSMDRPTELTYPDGDRITHHYNSRASLEQIVGGPSGSIIANLDYKPWDALARCEYGNGVITVHDYDSRLRLKDLDTDAGKETKLLDYTYHFDLASNLDRIDDNRSLAGQPDETKRRNTQAFGYDNLYRITSAAYPGILDGADGTIGYRYDRLGNMLEKTSNIPHLQDGLSVTNLGTMSYGGTAGTWGRTGRSGGEPGCHALTAVAAGNRSYPYDPNGNMTHIDGLICTWDFKDRLVRVENASMNAIYAYDYQNRRVIKQVTPKPGQPDAGQTRTTTYVNRYFEVRDHDVPVKYVWNGETRVARVTGTLSGDATRTQRLRLVQGWNLVAINVGGVEAQLNPATQPILEAAVKWNASSLSWLPATSEPLVAHTPCWLFANQAATLSLTGSKAANDFIPLSPGPQFVVNPGVEPLDVSAAFPASTDLLFFDRSEARWRARYAGGAVAVSDAPAALSVGESVFVRLSEGETVLQLPNASLQIRYYHQDHLGSSSVQTDRLGGLVEEVAYYPFGHPRNGYRPASLVDPYGFTQKERDLESGLHCFEARFMVASLCRFASVDSASFTPTPRGAGTQGSHQYAYVGNNPLRFVDPTGCFTEETENGVVYIIPDGSDDVGKEDWTTKISQAKFGSMAEEVYRSRLKPAAEALESQGLKEGQEDLFDYNKIIAGKRTFIDVEATARLLGETLQEGNPQGGGPPVVGQGGGSMSPPAQSSGLPSDIFTLGTGRDGDKLSPLTLSDRYGPYVGRGLGILDQVLKQPGTAQALSLALGGPAPNWQKGTLPPRFQMSLGLELTFDF